MGAVISFSPSVFGDIPQIEEWTQHDPYHSHQNQPEWWLTENSSLLAFCLMDARGPLSYVRLDVEGEYIRLHTQFAPRSVVSRHRLVVGMLECMRRLIALYRADRCFKGIVFNSVSPSLIAFMQKHHGFKSVGSDDYRLDFEEQQ
ncbi:Uncharacterised protein [uncultured archaeon]|nr:Uncharacterised protein [uncultured archaeon]